MRALAVVPVILFHGGFTGFSGGFVGVDVFFVISGYLITGILVEDISQDRFSLIEFYERRARRILPALFVVVLACVPFALTWFAPQDLLDFAESVISTATFWSNILFWRESGYFDTAAELKPLLHTWSLSVEEQFYLFFPLLLLVVWRFGRSVVLGVLIAILLMSLALAQWGVVNAPSATYYLLPTRIWELLLGALAALAVHFGWVRFSRGIEEALGQLGLLMICLSVIAFDEATPFPGLSALLPTVGTILVLLPAQSVTIAHRILSLPVMVGVGLISYSAYLWHQPLFAFAQYRTFGEPPDLLIFALVIVTVVLAYTSWRFVESPFRNRTLTSRAVVFRGGMVTGAVLCGFGVVVVANDGFPSRLSIPASVEASMTRTSREAECFDKPGLHEIDDWSCVLGVDAAPEFIVFGDSHALSLLDAIDAAATQADLSGEFAGASGCAPLLGIHALRSDQNVRNCHAANVRLLEYAKELAVDHVMLVARWTYYTDGDYEGTGVSHIALSPQGPRTQAESRAAFEEGLATTIQAYRDAGIGLTFIEQVPQQMMEPMHAYRRAHMVDERVDASLRKSSVSRARHDGLQAYVRGLFREYDAPMLDFTGQLCDSEICLIGTPDQSYYFDDDHLSLVGAERLVPAIRLYLEQRVGRN